MIGQLSGWTAFLLAIVLALLPAALSGCSGGQKTDQERGPGADAGKSSARSGEKPGAAARGLFVTRWDYRAPADVQRIVEQAKAAGFTDLYWQVRGQCDAFYAGALEPWGEQIAGDGEGPGFDPLAEAVVAAQEQGLRLHAWMNTLTLWHGTAAPRSDAHLRNASPQWRLSGAGGAPVRTRDGYELLNPTLPEVRAHLERVTGDLCARYELDGVCFDVLRLPPGTGSPGDPASKRMFADENSDALGAGADRARVAAEWMTGKLTLLAMSLSEVARSQRPGIEVAFVTVAATPAAAQEQGQEAAAWVNAGIADEIIVLVASDATSAAAEVMTAWREAGDSKRGVPVIAAILPVTQTDPAVLGEQIRVAGKNTPVAVFGYSSLFESMDGAVARDPRSMALRTARREAVTKVLNPKVAKPEEAASLAAARGVPTEENSDATKASPDARTDPDGTSGRDAKTDDSLPEDREGEAAEKDQSPVPPQQNDDGEDENPAPDPKAGEDRDSDDASVGARFAETPQ